MHRFLFIPLALLAACAAPSSDATDEAASSEAAVSGTTSYAAEARFVVAGEPARRVRARIELASNATSSSVVASHETTYDEGSFRHDSCVTRIAFPGGHANIEVLDDATGTALASYQRPIALGAAFDSPTNENSTCYPHGYADLSQDTSIGISPDAITYADGTKIDRISMSFDVHVTAVRDGASWKLTGVSLDPYAYSNLNHDASFTLPSGALDFTPIYAAGKRSPHTVKARIETASCALTDPYGVIGDVEAGTFHFAFDYRRKLEAGAKVFVKYAERLGFTTTQPAWSDAKQVELTPSGDAWTGEVTLTGNVRPAKGFPDATQRDAVAEAGAPSSLLYVFRIHHADGTDEWENGSAAAWGNYRTTGDQGGRYGYYGLVLPASCDGLGRESELGAEIDAHR